MFVMPDSVIPVSVMPVSSFTLYLIPHLNINVIPDSVMPESVISLSTFCYAKFPFPEKCYARFLFLVIPDSVIPVSVMPVSSFLLYLIPESEIHVIPDSVIPVSVISLSTFLLCLIPLYQVPLYSFPISKIIPDSVIPLSVIPKSVMPGSPPPIILAKMRLSGPPWKNPRYRHQIILLQLEFPVGIGGCSTWRRQKRQCGLASGTSENGCRGNYGRCEQIATKEIYFFIAICSHRP